MNKDPESWARVRPDAFLTGSIAQARNVIEMAVQDIAHLAAQRNELVKALEGVIRVADRKTDEFDAARAALAKVSS